MPEPTTRIFYAAELELDLLIHQLDAWFDSRNMEAQSVKGSTGSTVLQCRERPKWRKFVGLSAALNIELTYDDPRLEVTIGLGKWIDKAMVGGVAVVAHAILWPIAIPAVVGFVQERRLPDKVFTFIESYVAAEGKRSSKRRTSERARDPLEQLQRSAGRANRFSSHRESEIDEPTADRRTTSMADDDEELVLTDYGRDRERRPGVGSMTSGGDLPRLTPCVACGEPIAAGASRCPQGHER